MVLSIDFSYLEILLTKQIDPIESIEQFGELGEKHNTYWGKTIISCLTIGLKISRQMLMEL